MGKYFGTDGARGVANVLLTPEVAYRIGRFIGYQANDTSSHNRKARIVIGKDTRISSDMLEAAIASGIAASGTDVFLMGITTTAAISYITEKEAFSYGVMITASHNPYYDNGIKIVDAGGKKLDDATTDIMEAYIDGDLLNSCPALPYAKNDTIGRILAYNSGRESYKDRLISSMKNKLDGIKVGLDTSNGSAYRIAREVFEALGAVVVSVADNPNGININDKCGSGHMESLCRLVKENNLDVGFAFDGDADRCIASDTNGNVVDGDKIIYILAQRLKRLGKLPHNTVVVTVNSNSGFIKSLTKSGINADICNVGDRFVSERIDEGGYSLGGEQSGHVIIRENGPVGDGILTAIEVCNEMVDMDMCISELVSDVETYPQYSKSVKVNDKVTVMKSEKLRMEKEIAEEKIGERGRILIRPSGTEPIIRIMVECESLMLAKECADRIAKSIDNGE